MISYEQAFALVENAAKQLPTTTTLTKYASGSFLAKPINAPFGLPRFTNSAVDGYGVRALDFQTASSTNPIPLQVITTIPAGSTWQGVLSYQTGVKILTGAPIPEGVDAMLMREDVETETGILVSISPRIGQNIRYAGEELALGSEVLSDNIYISPAVIGLLSTFGIQSVPVFRKPRVAIIATGDELLLDDAELVDGKIFDSNSPSLIAALQSLNIEATLYQTAQDTTDSLKKVLTEAMKHADIVITTGGVSVGEYDLIREVSHSLQVTEVFWNAAIKPGKPIYFGTFGSNSEKLFFGLPGNPVAVLVTFELFVLPAICKMMGAKNYRTNVLNGTLTKTVRKKAGRMEFVRTVANWESGGYLITPVIGQESHMLTGFAHANALMHFPCDKSELLTGTVVEFQFFSSAQTWITR